MILGDGLRGSILPWGVESHAQDDLRGRIESISIGKYRICKIRSSPILRYRRWREIAASGVSGTFVTQKLAGDSAFTIDNAQFMVSSGDLIVCDSRRSIAIEDNFNTEHASITLFISTEIDRIANRLYRDSNATIRIPKSSNPLISIMTYLSDNLISSSYGEIKALVESFDLILLSATSDKSRASEQQIQTQNYATRRLILFIEQNISDPSLSPQMAADHVGISVRYIHKLLHETGSTFNELVTSRRLELVAEEISKRSDRGRPIGQIARSTGFRDISAFNRAFRKKFRCTPTSYRDHTVHRDL